MFFGDGTERFITRNKFNCLNIAAFANNFECLDGTQVPVTVMKS